MRSIRAVFKLPEVAQRLGVSLRTVSRMVADGDLQVVKLRGATRVPKTELQRLLRCQNSTLPDRKRAAANDRD